MKTSVVLTTYNGKKYLTEQLDSILQQTQPADEVLIFDDRSTDQTPELVREYIQNHRLTNWKLTVNAENLGWKKNFMQGMRQAAGDVIFPCDQDDCWYPEKIKVMTEQLVANPRILLLAGELEVHYEKGAIHTKHEESARPGESLLTACPFEKSFFQCRRPGCAYAVRGSFFGEVNELWQPDFPHDEFLWLMALLRQGAWFYNAPLVRFNRHTGNASDIRFKDLKMQAAQLDYIGRLLAVMAESAQKNAVPQAVCQTISAAQKWCQKRKKLIATRNPLRWLGLAPWFEYYNSPQNCLSDLYLVLFGSFKRR